MTPTKSSQVYSVSVQQQENIVSAKPYMTARWEAYRYEAFWSRVDKRSSDQCWDWKGLKHKSPKNPTPYGMLGWKGRSSRAHRVAYEIAFGSIPEGQMVLHRCDNTLCCNPSHLYLGDHAQNMKDMVIRLRRKGVGKGEANGRSKITQDQADAIRALYAAGGVSQESIAKLYGISQFAVSAITRNKRYAK